jgi:uncharacterized protein YyaL (SSP411 family)
LLIGSIFVEKEKLGKGKSNRLINEKSPYLLQHAYNPVDWYPWGSEAFDRAKVEDKPVFVSIGYSSCHWCHVMEKECFEDVEVAGLMNLAFVCVKVDREERPDIDAVYMAACRALGKSCGWPLNVLLTPNKAPFFVASYIPKNSRFGLVGMLDLVPQLMEIWRMRRVELESVGAEVKGRIEDLEKRTPENVLGIDILDDGYEKLVLDFDTVYGGFGRAPKFPRPHSLLFLLRYWKRTGEKNALDMVEKTLRMMRLGGIFDQVGFGFHRYSTDDKWLVPHFEKMLYDQALLALTYMEAYLATGAGKFKLTAKEVLDYVLRDLTSPAGGFVSAEDADSEGEEGKFYLWTKQEVKDVLPAEDGDLAVDLFGLEAEGNYVDGFLKSRSGKNILHLPRSFDELALERGLSVDELIVRLGRIRDVLFEARKERVAPAMDDKVLVDWNGLMIAAFARASWVFGEKRFLGAAVGAADFVLDKMVDERGVLFHRYAKGERAIEGFLDDYAFFVFGLLELYGVSFEEKYLDAAKALTKAMFELFWDEKDGGFYLTAKGGDVTLPRLKQVYDGAVPSGNSVALHCLLRLGRLVSDPIYEQRANLLLKVFSEEVSTAPQAYTFFLAGLDFAFGPSTSVVLAGDLGDKDLQFMLDALRIRYLPNLAISLKNSVNARRGYEKIDGKATAYVCLGQICMAPTNSVKKMLELFNVG